MASKHYDINYLENTGKTLKNLKEYSYHTFTTITGGTIIDLGCGTGGDVVNLAALVPDDVKLVGIDHDRVMLDKARSLSAGKKNLEFITAEVYPLPYETGSIAGIRAERLIQHLSNAQEVIAETHRVLKKGGPLLIVETDWHSLAFYTSQHAVEKKINDFLTNSKVKNGLAARNLTSYLETCGFNNIKIELFPIIFPSLKDANDNLWIERIADEAADMNFITQVESDLFKQALQIADEKKYFACSINLIIVSAFK